MTRRLFFILLWGLLAGSVRPESARAYIADSRWNSTAVDGDSGTMGTPITLTWSLARDGTKIPGEDGETVSSDLIGFLDDNWGAGGDDLAERPWFSLFEQSFARLSDLSGVAYVYEPNDNGSAFSTSARGSLGVRGDIRLGGKSYGSGSNTLASNFYPDYGEMMINTDKASYFVNSSNDYRRLRNTLMHEAMHGLGVSHVESSSSGFLIEPTLSTAFDGPQLDDVLALQRLYGDVYEKEGGNDAAAAAASLGAVDPTQSRVIGTLGGSTTIGPTQTDFVSIDDDSDTDFFSFTIAEKLDVSLTLTPRGVTYQVGPPDGNEASIDTLAISNLSLALFDPDGATILSAADDNGARLGEALIEELNPGTYYARIKGDQNDIQLYQLAISGKTPGPAELIWSGLGDAKWDVGASANFKNGLAADEFEEGDHAVFNDVASLRNVDIVEDVAPGSIRIETAEAYRFAGVGGIVAGELIIAGAGSVELANAGNSYEGPTLIKEGTLLITGDANAMVTPITVASGATLVMNSSDAAAMASPIIIQPGGLLEVGASQTAANVLSEASPGIVNDGLMRILDREQISGVSGEGAIVVERESSPFSGNAGFNGAITVVAGATAEVGDNNAFGDPSQGVAVEAGAAVVVDVDAQLLEPLSLSGGTVRIGAQRTVELLGGVSAPAGGATIEVGAGASLAVQGAVDASAADSSVVLAVEEGAELLFTGAATFAGGLHKLGGGTAELRGTGDVGDVTRVEAGKLILAGDGMLDSHFQVDAGATLGIAGGHAFASTSSLTGDGDVEGNFSFPGAVNPGGSVGALTITGDLSLSQSARVEMEIGGLQPVELYDQLNILGAAELGGMLDVELVGGFMPELGDAFRLLTASEVVNRFADAVLPELGEGLAWNIGYNAEGVILSVASAAVLAPADFNEDGLVDGGDLALWQAGYGAGGDASQRQGDADGNLAVDGHDFLLWQRQAVFALDPATGLLGVPEPGAATLAVGWLAAAALWRGGGRRFRIAI